MGVCLGVLSRARLIPAGVREGLKDTDRFPDTDADEGITSLCTGGRVESSRFFFNWKCERSRFVPSIDAGRGDEAAAGILLASARGLDMRSKDCRTRLAVALVSPQGCEPAGLALICRLTGAW